MDRARLVAALGAKLDSDLAAALVDNYLKLRQDAATRTLERAVAGKFVETFVQCLQWLSGGAFEKKPDVDVYLSKKVEGEMTLPEGLRICGARAARAIYAMRNKRNIAHIAEVDPNTIDLAYTAHASAWIMSEMVRVATGVPMAEAGHVIEVLQLPLDDLIEDIGDVRLIHGKFNIEEELLVLLRSYYPDDVPVANILRSLERWSEGSVRNKLRDLVENKLAFGNTKSGFRLTKVGYQKALAIITRSVEVERAS
jgi:hypothetical protein